MSTIVFGYSENPERYSFKAYTLLKEFEYDAIPFNPRTDDISSIKHPFDTLTMYVGEAISEKYSEQILKLNFKRIIFNPGAENPSLEKKCLEKNIEVVHGCTLVMLKTDQY
jgi:predicted CoA-binding protein